MLEFSFDLKLTVARILHRWWSVSSPESGLFIFLVIFG